MLVLPIARFCITIIIIAAAAAATTTTTTATAYYYPSLPSRKIALIPIRYRWSVVINVTGLRHSHASPAIANPNMYIIGFNETARPLAVY